MMMAFFLLFSLISVVVCDVNVCLRAELGGCDCDWVVWGDDVHSEIPEINNNNNVGGGGFMQMPIKFP